MNLLILFNLTASDTLIAPSKSTLKVKSKPLPPAPALNTTESNPIKDLEISSTVELVISISKEYFTPIS
ncbi:hypothetical protein WICMUC_003927 [Wickerhamomyces mucosus]|uniref:Uncharacterized protein n=1 Tax=Wickerhamomyces mucosus TaxID=1378264 RepID=A0A9P8PKS4_9ASCO|nr:hypothetical protein WICMUC_003927 [Wickerhamomyces mucosus]